MEMTGVESSGLTKAIRRFEAAVEEFVEKQGFVHEDYVLTEPFSALARFGELVTLNKGITSNAEMEEEANKLAEELLVKLSRIYSNKYSNVSAENLYVRT